MPALFLSVLLLGAGATSAQNLPPSFTGFPLTLTGEGNLEHSQPVAADLGTLAGGTAGYLEIVFGTKQGDLHVIHRLTNGTWGEAPGFPVTVGAYIASSPAVGDLTGDGVPEIVVGHGSHLTGGGGPGGVKAYRNDGSLLWTTDSLDYVTGQDGQPDAVFGTPAIGDVDGDGQNEVAWGGFDFRIHLVSGDTGDYEAGWPLFIRDSIWSSPALHDIDGDGKPDIIIGVDAHNEPGFGTQDGGSLHVLRYDATQTCSNANPESCTMPTEVAGFPKHVDQVVFSPPSVGDIDGDGEPEIVHGTGTYWPGRSKKVYAWNCDGSAVAGWPVTLQEESSFSPALANLDGDAALEVVVSAADAPSGSYRLYRFEGDGTQTFRVAPKDFFGVTQGIGHPVIADVLGDATPEILTPTNGSVAVFSAGGTLLTDDGSHPPGAYAFYTETSLSGVAVTDLNGDGKLEVIAISGSPFPSAANTKINVWNPVNRTSAAPPWGFFRQDAARSGVAPGTGPCTSPCTIPQAATDFYTVTPCRVINTRTTHTPALVNGQARTFTIAGSCGIPATATAISVNVTVTQPTNTGHVRFGPGGCTQLPTSAINFGPGQTRANNAILPLANDGSGTLTAIPAVLGSGSVHLLIDVNGYFEEP